MSHPKTSSTQKTNTDQRDNTPEQMTTESLEKTTGGSFWSVLKKTGQTQ